MQCFVGSGCAALALSSKKLAGALSARDAVLPRSAQRQRRACGAVVRASAGQDGLWWDSSVNSLYGPAPSGSSKNDNVFRDDSKSAFEKQSPQSPSGSSYLDSLQESSNSGSPRKLYSAQPTPQYSGNRSPSGNPSSSGNRYSAADQIAAIRSEESRFQKPVAPPQGSYQGAISPGNTSPRGYTTSSPTPAPVSSNSGSYLDALSGGGSPSHQSSASSSRKRPTPLTPEQMAPASTGSYLDQLSPRSQAQVRSYVEALSPNSQMSYLESLKSGAASVTPKNNQRGGSGATSAAQTVSQSSYLDSIGSPREPERNQPAYSQSQSSASSSRAAPSPGGGGSSYLDSLASPRDNSSYSYDNGSSKSNRSQSSSYAPPQTNDSSSSMNYSSRQSDSSSPRNNYSSPQSNYSPPQNNYSSSQSNYSSPQSNYSSSQNNYSSSEKNDYSSSSNNYSSSQRNDYSSSSNNYSSSSAPSSPNTASYLEALSSPSRSSPRSSSSPSSPSGSSGSSYLDSLSRPSGGYSPPMQSQQQSQQQWSPSGATQYAEKPKDLGFTGSQQSVGFTESPSTTSTSTSQSTSQTAAVPAASADTVVMPKGYAVLEAFLEDVAARPTLYLNIGGISSGVIALAAVLSAVLDQLNNVPVVPDALKLIGVAYSAWFFVRYSVSRDFRENLNKDVAGTFDVPRQEV